MGHIFSFHEVVPLGLEADHHDARGRAMVANIGNNLKCVVHLGTVGSWADQMCDGVGQGDRGVASEYYYEGRPGPLEGPLQVWASGST